MVETLFPVARNVNEGRTQINIVERAQAITWKNDYTLEYNGAGIYTMTKLVDLQVTTDVYTVNTVRRTCDCPSFGKYGDCKHRIGLALLIEKNNDEALATAYEESMAACELETTGCDPYARY